MGEDGVREDGGREGRCLVTSAHCTGQGHRRGVGGHFGRLIIFKRIIFSGHEIIKSSW